MSLNYGLSSNDSGGPSVPTLTPTRSGVCIFNVIDNSVKGEFPNPPGHSAIYIPISEVGVDSVIHITSHTFSVDVADDVNSTIEYYIIAFKKSVVSHTSFKIAEHRPIISTGTYYASIIDKKVRVGDSISQSELDDHSFFRFACKRKTNPLGGTIGGSVNMMYYTIYTQG